MLGTVMSIELRDTPVSLTIIVTDRGFNMSHIDVEPDESFSFQLLARLAPETWLCSPCHWRIAGLSEDRMDNAACVMAQLASLELKVACCRFLVLLLPALADLQYFRTFYSVL